MMAEGRRVFAAEEFVSIRLLAAMSILKAVRKAEGITLDEVTAKAGMTKPYLSKLENDAAANVTVNTLYRIADALGHDLQISVIPRLQSKSKSKTKNPRTAVNDRPIESTRDRARRARCQVRR